VASTNSINDLNGLLATGALPEPLRYPALVPPEALG